MKQFEDEAEIEYLKSQDRAKKTKQTQFGHDPECPDDEEE